MGRAAVDFGEAAFPFAPERVAEAVEYARRHGLTREWRDSNDAGTGLVLRVGPTRASFYARVRVGGRMVSKKLGSAYGTGRLSVDDARRDVQRLRFGTIPERARAADEPPEQAGGPTVQETFDHYIADAESGRFSMRRRARRPLAPKTARGYRSIFSAHLKAHGGQPLAWLADSAGEIFERLGSSGHGALANQFAAVTRAMFDHARRAGTWSGPNPIRDPDQFEKFHVRSREVGLTDEQGARLFAALRDEHPTFRDLFTLAAFTGQRIGNVRALRWSQVDLDRGLIRFRSVERKNQSADAVPLAAESILLLKARRKAALPGAEFVFPSESPRGAGKPICNYAPAWARVKAAAGLDDVPDLVVHGLRHIFCTLAQEAGIESDSISAAVGHLSRQSTERYKGGRSVVVGRAAVEGIAARLRPMLKRSQSVRLKPKSK